MRLSTNNYDWHTKRDDIFSKDVIPGSLLSPFVMLSLSKHCRRVNHITNLLRLCLHFDKLNVTLENYFI